MGGVHISSGMMNAMKVKVATNKQRWPTFTHWQPSKYQHKKAKNGYNAKGTHPCHLANAYIIQELGVWIVSGNRQLHLEGALRGRLLEVVMHLACS